MAWMALFAVAVLLVSSPAQAGWINQSLPAVSSDWTLYGVYGVSKSEAWAIGSDFTNGEGVLLHFINGAWVSVPPPNVSAQWELFGVHFTSASAGWAVGADTFNRRGVLLRYQNGTWTSVPPPTVSSSWFLTSVQFTSASEGWAVGANDSIGAANQGVLLHFQNGSWTNVNPPYVLSTWFLNDVSLSSSQNGWAVGTGVQLQQKGVLLRWQSGRWDNILPPNVTDIWELVGVHFTSATDGWVVGNDFSYPVTTGIFMRFSNNSWTQVPFSRSNPNVSWFLSSIYFPVAGEGWATGMESPSATEGSGLLFHFKNGSWSAITPPIVSDLWALWNLHFPSADSGWAVGRDESNTRGVILRFSQKPEITVSPLAFNFKNVPTGTLAKQGITVRNDGGSNLILGTITTPADPFSRAGGRCQDGQVLGPGETCGVKIGFEPATAGTFQSSFDIGSNDTNEPVVTVTVKGRSGAADLTGEWKSLSQSCNSSTSVCKLSGSLRVRNVGYKNIDSASVRFFLSDDEVYDGVDQFLTKFGTGQLSWGDSKGFSFAYKLPVGETATGRYVIAVLDINNKIVELDETNNGIVFGPVP